MSIPVPPSFLSFKLTKSRGEDNKKMLGVEMHTTIYTLFKRGYNKSQIARLLDMDRNVNDKIKMY